MTGKQFLNIICGSTSAFGLSDKNPNDARYRATALGWLNLVLKDIQNRQQNFHFRWLEKTATTTTVSGQHTYDLPADCDTSKVLNLYDRTNDITLKYQEYNRFTELVPDPSEDSGDAYWWTFWANTIRLYPVPDSAYTLYLDYVKNITELADDDNTTDVPSKYDNLIISGAMVYVYKFDPKMGNWQTEKQSYELEIQKMIQDNAQMIASKGVPVSHRERRSQRGDMSFQLEGY